MKLEGEQILLRVYLRNTDKHGWQTAADALVERARHDSLAGATVLRGVFGLDFDGNLLDSGRWSLVEHVPVIVEIVDQWQNISRFLASLPEIISTGVVTLERAHVIVYRQNRTAAASGPSPMPLQVPGSVADFSTLPTEEELPIMKLAEDGQLLRVFIGDSDVWQGEPLARAIVLKARELGLAGATVLHGAIGFGANSRVHTARLLELSTDLPVVVEIVDAADKIQSLLPFLDQAVQEGLITVEGVKVLKYRHAAASS